MAPLCTVERFVYYPAHVLHPSFPRNLNNHTTCEKGNTTILLSRRLPNWTNVTTLRAFRTKTVISSFFIFHSFYIRCCVLLTGFFYTLIWWYEENNCSVCLLRPGIHFLGNAVPSVMSHTVVSGAGLMDPSLTMYSSAIKIDYNVHRLQHITVEDNLADGVLVGRDLFTNCLM